MNDEILLLFWGKSDKNNPANYHPLLFHLLDVGHVALCLWDVLPQITRSAISEALCLPEEGARRLVVLLAAQHDLGKLSAFQLKPSLPDLFGRVKDAGFTIIRPNEEPHGYVTASCLPTAAIDGACGWIAPKPSALLLSKIVGGHHGIFPSDADYLAGKSPMAIGGSDWHVARHAMLERVVHVLFPNEPPVNIAAINHGALVPLVGGLVAVADWIGSSKKHFPPVGPMDINTYAAISLAKAKQALQDFGWTPPPQFAAPASFSTLFPKIKKPNAMQRMVVEIADAATTPYLMVIEAAMGGGKTEAAIYATDRALTIAMALGCYFAMPTQATGNAMFKRVLKDYLKERGHSRRLEMQLIHGGSFLSDVFDAIKLTPLYGGSGNTDDSVAAHSWFTSKKEALLARFGVGTIDQGLMGVLQTKHWFVRLFGLAGKVVIFDEVHAYDIYMSQLLKCLLGWLRALGCTVILLSATLPDTRRRELIGAWDSKAEVNAAEYPHITYINDAGAQSRHITADTDESGKQPEPKKIHVSYASTDLAMLADKIQTDMPNGGCAAVICNTVDRAQEARDLLREALPDWEVLLYHARTIVKWRREREQELHDLFGKEGTRPSRTVLIASPALQESLDLDFDWMASDFAPIDLILQRAGRLWRHDRVYRPVTQANLVVLCDNKPDGLPGFPDGSGYYETYIMLRSRLALSETIYSLPKDIDILVRTAYDDPEPPGLDEVWVNELAAEKDKMEAEREKDSSLAELCMVRDASYSAKDVLNIGAKAGDVKLELHDSDDPEVHKTIRAATRLGKPSITVICAGTDADGQPLATVPKGELDIHAARALLEFSVPISSEALYHSLVKQDVPKQWKDNAYLRYCRLVTFEQGVAMIGKKQIRLSEKVGLVKG